MVGFKILRLGVVGLKILHLVVAGPEILQLGPVGRRDATGVTVTYIR